MPDKERLFAVLQPTAGTLGNRGLRSHTEIDGHGAYIPVAIQAGATRENPASGPDGIGVRTDGVAYTIEARAEVQAVAQPVPFTKSKRAQSVTDDETWVDGQVNPTLSLFDQGDTRATTVAVAFANRTRDGIKMPEIMADGVTPALTNPGGGGRSDAINVAVAFHPLQDQISSTDGSTHCMGTGGSQGHASIAVAVAPSLTATNDPSRSPQSSEVTQQVAAVHASTMTVRRLSPRECERLQGFPDDYTLIPWRKKPAEECPDGPRYKALGNSMACNCMAWIGEQIAKWEADHA
jgi:site-specific DNA-cytosine methylase